MNLFEKWAELVPIEWWTWLAEHRVAAVLALFGLLLALLWLAGWQQKRLRSRLFLSAVKDATFGRCIERSRSGAWGFAVSIEPAPERFREFNISYQPMSIMDPVDFLRLCFGENKSQFQISGELIEAPAAEITWIRGKPPARSLGANPGRAPWVQSRLDFAGAEYATRGPNVGALKHVFQDMYARFTPGLRSITVQRERKPQMRIVVAGRLDVRDVSPLITSARALGRAASRD